MYVLVATHSKVKAFIPWTPRSWDRIPSKAQMFVLIFLYCAVQWRQRPCNGLTPVQDDLPDVELMQKMSENNSEPEQVKRLKLYKTSDSRRNSDAKFVQTDRHDLPTMSSFYILFKNNAYK